MIDYNQLAFKFSPAPLVVLRYKKMVEMNPAFSHLFGYAKEELLGLSIVKMFPNHYDFDTINQNILDYFVQQNSQFYSDQRLMQHKSGEIFWTYVHGQTLTPDDPFKLMVWHFERKDHHNNSIYKLTKRESEITQYIVNGLTCKEIARKLNLSYRTIEVHKANLMKKLNVHSKAELTSKIMIRE